MNGMNGDNGIRPDLPRVAVLGTGIMGAGMAERLLDQGFSVDVWDRTPAATARLAERGASAHARPADAVRVADVVVTMLPTGDAVDDVMLRQDVLAAMRPDGIWAQMGTVGTDAIGKLTAAVAALRPDVAFFDSPVLGTRDPARNGLLTILASGQERLRTTLEPVFNALGQRVVWLEPAGLGTKLKLVVNTWLAFEIEAVAEARSAAERLGVPYESLVAAVRGGAMASAFALTKLAKMESGDDSPQFPLEWALKDLDLTAAAAGVDAVPVSHAIAERWRTLVGQGAGRLDISAARLGLAADAPVGAKR
jgi:3-hydroxyisobutyrate dehydrogenase